MPYFPAGGGVAYQAPHVYTRSPSSYRQPVRGSRGRFGQSLSDILGTISDVAGTVSADTSGGVGANYYSAPPQSYYASASAATPTSGMSTTTLLLGGTAIGLLIFFATKRH